MTKQITFINANIFTANQTQPYATAMTVHDGKIIWIGEETELETIENAIDLKGRTVLPGLIDAHFHPLWLANASKQLACTPPLVHSIQDMIEQLRAVCMQQKMNSWIEGWGYDEGKLAERRSPSRHDLDQASSKQPIVITRTCTHIITVNSKALELAGITKDTPDPEGGQIDRDEWGEPTGVLRENARSLVTRIMPVKTVEEHAEALAELSPLLFSKGITAITDLMSLAKPIDYADMYETAAKKGLQQRSVLYYMWDELQQSPTLNSEKLDKSKQIHIGGMKLFADGSVSGKTAWVNPPFLGPENSCGIQTVSREELLGAAQTAKEHGIQLVVHAMGEQAIDFILDTFADTRRWLTDAPSIRIEHAAMPTKEAIKKAAALGVAIVTQPIFLFAEIESYLNNLGAERTKKTYPVQDILRAGIPVAFSSDAPATAWADPVNPFVGMQAAVTRLAYDGTDTGQAQRVNLETAITLYTRAAQEITRIPAVGQLIPGFYADFIVLDRDIFTVPPESIGEVQVLETYMGGSLVYKKEGAALQ